MIEFTPELKQKWIDALESGEYTRGIGALRTMLRPDNEPVSKTEFYHCCLGVLAEVTDGIEISVSGENTIYSSNSDKDSVEYPPSFGALFGYKHADALIRINDSHDELCTGYTAQIEYIKENL